MEILWIDRDSAASYLDVIYRHTNGRVYASWIRREHVWSTENIAKQIHETDDPEKVEEWLHLYRLRERLLLMANKIPKDVLVLMEQEVALSAL